MKLFLIAISTFLYNISYAQQLSFNGELVDSIFIKSHKSVYQFDKKGTTIGNANILSLVFDRKENQYVVNHFYEDKYKRTFNPDTINLKNRDLNRKKVQDIGPIVLSELLKALNTNINPDSLIYQIDTTALFNYVTEKRIKSIAKKYRLDWYFKPKYSTRDENKQFFNSYKSIDTLKLYLIDKYHDKGYVVITDYSNTINIWVSTSKKEYRFEGNHNPIKQPWYNHSDRSMHSTTSVLNIDINKSLLKILPTHFLLTKSISESALYDDYIKWYFKRFGMDISMNYR